MATIDGLDTEVLIKVENRSSTADIARARQWLRDALLEISGNRDYRDDFPELEVLGPTYNLTADTQEYAESNILPASDISIATLDIRLWTDPPTNSNSILLEHSHYQAEDQLSAGISTRPSKWFRFGSNIGFSPIPDDTYQVRARALRQHPISNPVQDTTILLPASWEEILVWSAALRGFMELELFDKAAAVRMLLNGDPKDPGNPGLIKSRKTKRAQEAHRRSGILQPVKRRYGF